MQSLLQRFNISLVHRYRASPAESWCAAFFREQKASHPLPGAAAPLVVVEAADDLYFYCLQGEIISALCAIRPVRVGRFATRRLIPGASRSLRGFISGWLDRHIFSRLRWKSLYDAFCDEVGDRVDYLRAPWREISWLWRAWRLFRGLESKDQLSSIRVHGIHIGDLVIDTYLRFKPVAEVNIRDLYLFVVLQQAVKDIDIARAYFRRAAPSLYLATYTTYIQHGIPARVAVALGITTWSFANAQEFGTRLTPDHPLQTKRSARYAADFADFADPAAKIVQAEKYLGNRVAGIADAATANQRSAYEVRTRDVPDVRGAAVIFLHDFFDSAHIYRWMVFHDFWEWVCTTIDVLQEAGLPFFIKPHPNQRAGSDVELHRLRRKYPGLNFISTDVSNRQLVDAGMACAITVYGSVAAEMAFLGVPSISSGDNPHASFDSFHLAGSKEEYRALLRHFADLPRDPERMQFQACAFYYMHNMNLRPEEQDLRDRIIAFFLALVGQEEALRSHAPSEMERIFSNLHSAPGFRHFVDGLAAELNDAVPTMTNSRPITGTKSGANRPAKSPTRGGGPAGRE